MTIWRGVAKTVADIAMRQYLPPVYVFDGPRTCRMAGSLPLNLATFLVGLLNIMCEMIQPYVIDFCGLGTVTYQAVHWTVVPSN